MTNREPSTPSIYPVVMPRLGLTMTEARIVEWLIPQGGWVEKGAPLFVLEHEKASLEIEAPASGRLHILVPIDTIVPILTPIAWLDAETIPETVSAADLAITSTPAAPAAGSVVSTAQTVTTGIGKATAGISRLLPTRATPRARAMARQNGIFLTDLPGSGPRGMVTSLDVAGILSATQVNASPLARKVALQEGLDIAGLSGSGPRGRVMRRDVEQAASLAHRAPPQPLANIPGLRGVIARRLSASWQERPQATLTIEADCTNLVALRQQIQAERGIKVSFNAILFKVTAQALAEHPRLRVRLTDSGLQVQEGIHLGLAVDTEQGLLVPVLRSVDALSMLEIHQRLDELTGRAVAGKCLPDELSGGIFTITNLGMYAIDLFTPIINPPECAILGVGRIALRPVCIAGGIVPRQMVNLSLSFDHRLVDGAPAARFLERIKILIERCFLLGVEK